jgi:hypothetical protein
MALGAVGGARPVCVCVSYDSRVVWGVWCVVVPLKPTKGVVVLFVGSGGCGKLAVGERIVCLSFW